LDVYIQGSHRPRPASARTIFCDGAADHAYRSGVDLELSHWLPNRTPKRFKADSSTEICLNFAAAGEDLDAYDLALNNHVDIDGVLSIFAVVEPGLAQTHRATLVQAAESGDFMAWADGPAMALCQALKLLQRRMAGADPCDTYAACLACTRNVLGGAVPAEVEPGLAALRASTEPIGHGIVAREVLGERFVHYLLPGAWAEQDLSRCLHVPSFDEPLSDRAALWPQARARLDAQRAQLVSVPLEGAWYHDLWLPGYAWADTVDRWRPEGLVHAGADIGHRLEHAGLRAAAQALQHEETNPGRWLVAQTISPFGALEGRGFPVVLSFMRHGRTAPSNLGPDRLREHLARQFGDGT